MPSDQFFTTKQNT